MSICQCCGKRVYSRYETICSECEKDFIESSQKSKKYGCYEHNGEKNFCDNCVCVANGCRMKYTNKID